MASRGRGARAKGAQFERDIAKILEEYTGVKFKRGLGQTRSAKTEGADVQADDHAINSAIHIECKRHSSVSIKPAFKQAVNDCDSAMPIVITKDDRKDTLLTMKFDDWLPMFKAWMDARDKNNTD